MINPKEFRIGNLVNYKGKVHEVVGTQKNHVYVLGETNDYFVNKDNLELEPIILTEEWLMRFRGKPLENGYWISLYNLRAEFHFELFKNTDEIVTRVKSDFSDLILDRIKYVHQLQNLYFALTGEGLTLNNKIL